MAQPFAPRFRRPLVVLLCAQFLLTACGATELPAVGAGTARWPKPVLQVAQTEPNFQAPSAAHCARPVQTHETPGTRNNAQLERRRLADESGDATPTGGSRKSASPAAAAKAYGSTASELAAVSPSVAEAPPAAIVPPASPAPRVSIKQPAQAARPANEPVTAGMVDDNADFTNT